MRLATMLLATLLPLAASTAHAQTLEQMAGQMIVVGFTGNGVDDKGVVRLVDTGVKVESHGKDFVEAIRKLKG